MRPYKQTIFLTLAPDLNMGPKSRQPRTVQNKKLAAREPSLTLCQPAFTQNDPCRSRDTHTGTQATVPVLEHSSRPSSILCVGTRMYPHQMRSSVFYMAFSTLKRQQVPGFLLTESIENGCLGSSFNVVSMGEQQQSKTTSPFLPACSFDTYSHSQTKTDRILRQRTFSVSFPVINQTLNSKLLSSDGP